MSEFLNAATLTRLMRPGDFKDDALAQSITADQRAAVAEAMHHLQSYQHAVILMRYQRGFSVEHTARELLVSPEIVRSRETEALNVLRRHLPDNRAAIASAANIRYTKDETKEPKMPVKPGRKLPRYDHAAMYAWLDEHPKSSLDALSKQFGCSVPTAVNVRRAWRVQRANVEQDTILTMPERPVVAKYTPIAMRQPAAHPVTAPATRTWYEEQIFQARTFCEVLEEQERAALAYYQQRQEGTKAARRRYDEAVRIAEQFSRMTRGQIIERIGIEQ